MNENQFKKIDETVFHKMKRFSREVPKEILKDFSASVAQKIRERENERILARERRPAFGLRILVPVFAVFLLFFTVIFRNPASMKMTDPMLPMLSATTSEITDEVTALKAVGAWNDDDDKAIVSDEGVLAEMEMA